ncbi:hypothetical protein AB0L22_08655 [Micromonospora haikouensis]|uniref:hypothetical protein n=1 Tax=Micromonospora haikouensis TaxID=686309 RepID=UPI003432F409
MSVALTAVAVPAVTTLPKCAARTYDQFVHDQYEADRAAELDALCRFCGPEGSTGPDCGTCPNGPAVAA